MQNDIGPLLHHLTSELNKISEQILRERLGIGLSQFRLLLVLRIREGILQKEIAGELAQTEASISRQVKLMKNKNLLEVKNNPGNRRERNIYLSPKGRDMSLRATEVLNEYHAPLFAKLDEDEQRYLIKILQKITKIIATSAK